MIFENIKYFEYLNFDQFMISKVFLEVLMSDIHDIEHIIISGCSAAR